MKTQFLFFITICLVSCSNQEHINLYNKPNQSHEFKASFLKNGDTTNTYLMRMTVLREQPKRRNTFKISIGSSEARPVKWGIYSLNSTTPLYTATNSISYSAGYINIGLPLVGPFEILGRAIFPFHDEDLKLREQKSGSGLHQVNTGKELSGKYNFLTYSSSTTYTSDTTVIYKGATLRCRKYVSTNSSDELKIMNHYVYNAHTGFVKLIYTLPDNRQIIITRL